KIDPWWFATCKCPRIYQKHLGDFHCGKCNAKKFTAAPMVRLTFEVDDETGFALFEGFDSVLVSIAAPGSSFKGLSTDKFYKAFKLIMGKSIMFIVRKIVHQTGTSECSFELLRVCNHPSVINYFTEIGVYITPSKNVRRRVRNDRRQQNPANVVSCTTTISELVDEYLVAAAANMSSDDGASSSHSKRPRI
ncbi:replication factor-A carboxy-terminal domain protein, partial [Trifolium pratense]